MNKIESKAMDIYIMGHAVVSEKDAPAIMEELEKYNGIYYDDFRMNGLVKIEKGDVL